VIDQNGHSHTTPVIDNVYLSSDLPQIASTSIVALNQDGHIIYRQAVNSPAIPKPAIPTPATP